MNTTDFAQGLVKLGFEKQNVRTRRDHQIYLCKRWSVWFESERLGMWIWIDKGQNIIRRFIETEDEGMEILKKLESLMKKTD